MTTLTAPVQASIGTPGPPGSPRLRVRREGQADQTIELQGAKCTIGSSARCHVRLPASESQPLECLLSLEAGAAVATRWASGVLLNGRTFAKQEFRAGDTLSIGPWEIEWEGRTPAPRGPAARPEPTQRETIDYTPPTLETPARNLRSTEPFVPPRPAADWRPPAGAVEAPGDSSAVLVAPPRPAAKTRLMSSRQTDPIVQPLGPSNSTIAAPALDPLPQTPVAAPNVSSMAFEDRLVAKLWTANYSARRRVKSLATAARAARARADELTTAVAAAEGRLSAARALNESATAGLQTQLASLRGELLRAIAERDGVAAELKAARIAPAPTAPPDARLQILADAAAKAERDAAETREALAVGNEQIESLREQCAEAESALAAAVAAESLAEKAKLAAELQLAELQVAADERQRTTLLAEHDARDQQRLIAHQEAAELRDALAACNEQIRALHEQCSAAESALCDATAAQAAAEKSHLAAERQLAEQHVAAEQRQQSALLAEREAHDRQRLIVEQEAVELREALAVCNEQIESLRKQCDAAEAARLAAQAAQDLAEVAHAAPAKQLAELQGAADGGQGADLLAERTAREQERRIADKEAARLREQLYACESQIETLRTQLAEGEEARSALDDRLAAVQQQQDQWLSQCQALERDRAATLAEATTERDELRRQLDALESQPAAAAPSMLASWPTRDANSPAEADSSEIEQDASTPARRHGWEDADRNADEADAEAAYAADAEIIDLADVPEAVEVEEASVVASPPPASVREAPAAPFAPPSFIDKYRHLLDEEGDAEPPLSASRPILDEEHMSPEKAMETAAADDDSDEALEAYMSNMMRRVRGDGSTPASQAFSSPTHVQQPAESLPEAAITLAVGEEPEIEIDANGMLRLVRKQHATTDITALRELANSSARTAIAHHHKRRHVQSAVTKAIVFAVASAASAYLMLTATGADSPWFWGGCVTLVMAAASAAQLAVLAAQRVAQWRRTPAKAVAPATAPAPDAPIAE